MKKPAQSRRPENVTAIQKWQAGFSLPWAPRVLIPAPRQAHKQRVTLASFDWVFDAFAHGENFTAFDIETTGLDNRRDSIVEIGAIRFNGNGIIGRYAQLIDPGVPMPEEAGSVNNITDIMLAGQPPIQEVLPAFLQFSADSIILAHNAPFDCGFVNISLSRLYDDGYVRHAVFSNRIADTLPMVRRLLPGSGRHNLQSVAAYLGIKAEAAHRALDDARLCMEIFLHLVRKQAQT